jgi:hypothetical protein
MADGYAACLSVLMTRGAGFSAQGFGEKALGSCCIAFGREQEVDRRTCGVHRAV